MAYKDDLKDLADSNDVETTSKDTVADLEAKLEAAGVALPEREPQGNGPGSGPADDLEGDAAQASYGDAGADGMREALGLDTGVIGTPVDPRPNEAYSLESGPDSPSALEQRQDMLEQSTTVAPQDAPDTD